uniref:F-box domain-containing protein n=2 Tax=Meloidogyne TaxID=189290 RepID=A0A914M9S6_MELIC
MNFLPAETNLDILKCLNFNQLNNCQLSNRRFSEVIVKYSKELATRKVFYSVELVVWKNYVCKDLVNYGGPNKMDLDLSEENKLKWKAAIQERTPFYFYYTSYSPRKKFDVALDDYKMNEVAYLFLVPKESDRTSPKFLRLKLHQYPETIEEMLVFRYWLEKLSNCFIENFKIEQGYINPEILQLFFGDSPLKFHTKCFYLYDEEGEYFPKAYEFMYHHVVIHGCKGFYYQYPDWNMRGEMIKNEERHFIGEDVEEFCKVVEYKLDGIDPKDSGILYVCYHIGSKEPFFFEIKGPGMI